MVIGMMLQPAGVPVTFVENVLLDESVTSFLVGAIVVRHILWPFVLYLLKKVFRGCSYCRV